MHQKIKIIFGKMDFVPEFIFFIFCTARFWLASLGDSPLSVPSPRPPFSSKQLKKEIHKRRSVGFPLLSGVFRSVQSLVAAFILPHILRLLVF